MPVLLIHLTLCFDLHGFGLGAPHCGVRLGSLARHVTALSSRVRAKSRGYFPGAASQEAGHCDFHMLLHLRGLACPSLRRGAEGGSGLPVARYLWFPFRRCRHGASRQRACLPPVPIGGTWAVMVNLHSRAPVGPGTARSEGPDLISRKGRNAPAVGARCGSVPRRAAPRRRAFSTRCSRKRNLCFRS